jgi:hypothetical protein
MSLIHIADAEVQCFQGTACGTGLPKVNASQENLTIALQLAFGIIGAIAVIVIMIGAFSMVAAQGDPGKVAKARQTVIFAIIGLAIAVSAEAIVVFTLGRA